MCVLLITRLLRVVVRWARKPVNHTSWMAVVTPTDRPKSVRNRCLIELFCGVVCVVTLPFWYFCWCRGFCHRTGSDLLYFFSKTKELTWRYNHCCTNNIVSRWTFIDSWKLEQGPCALPQRSKCLILNTECGQNIFMSLLTSSLLEHYASLARLHK